MRVKATQPKSKDEVAEGTAQSLSFPATRAPRPQSLADSLLTLQRTFGNRYVQRVLTLAGEADGELTGVQAELGASVLRALGGSQPAGGGTRVRANVEHAVGLALQLNAVGALRARTSLSRAAVQRDTLKVPPRQIPRAHEIDERALPLAKKMGDALDHWKNQANWGIQNFVNEELEKRIDKLLSAGLTT